MGIAQQLRTWGKATDRILQKLLPPEPGMEDLAAAVGYVENAGNPYNSVTPDFIGQRLFDTTNNVWYQAYGITSTTWRPVMQGAVDASGNITGLVGVGGVTIQIGQSQESTPTDLPFLSLRSDANYDLVAVPSPYSPAHTLHFSPVYFKNGFNGWKYWMAFTPYPDSDSVYENPCIVVSQDGRTWTVPTGVTNPIFAKPTAASAYNSDTDLYWDDTNSRFVLVWRTAGELSGTDTGLFVSTSADGITWATRTRIWTGVISLTDIASPSIWYNDTIAKWEIVGHRIDAASPFPFVKITSSSLLSGWDAASTVLTMTEPSGRAWWHSTFRRLPGGIIVGLLQDNNGTPGASGNLYSAYSADGATFYTSSLDLNGSWYRPSFVLRDDVLDGEWVCEFYGSKLTTSGTYRAMLRFNKGEGMADFLQTRSALLNAAVIGGFSSTTLLQVDTFNRTDDATTLGTATSGGAWTQIVGPTNVLGISTNRCYNVTSGNCRSTRDVGVTDYVVRATFLTKAGENWLWIRYVDTSNFIRIGCTSSGALRYQVVTSGSAVTDTAVSGIPANGDEVIIRAAGAEISIWHNEKYCGKYFSVQGITSTTVGIQMAGTTGYLDNYICHAL
jgi:hypothetical protein